jgi:hypothetical protein
VLLPKLRGKKEEKWKLVPPLFFPVLLSQLRRKEK